MASLAQKWNQLSLRDRALAVTATTTTAALMAAAGIVQISQPTTAPIDTAATPLTNGTCGENGMICSNLQLKQLMIGDAASPLAAGIRAGAAKDGLFVPDADIVKAMTMMQIGGALDSASPTAIIGKSNTLTLVKAPQPLALTRDGEYVGGTSNHGLYALIGAGKECHMYEVAVGSGVGTSVQLRPTDIRLIPTGSHGAVNAPCYNDTAALAKKLANGLAMNRI